MGMGSRGAAFLGGSEEYSGGSKTSLPHPVNNHGGKVSSGNDLRSLWERVREWRHRNERRGFSRHHPGPIPAAGSTFLTERAAYVLMDRWKKEDCSRPFSGSNPGISPGSGSGIFSGPSQGGFLCENHPCVFHCIPDKTMSFQGVQDTS